MSKKGKSVSAIAAKLKVDRSTLYRWASEKPEFGKAFKEAKDLVTAYWEDWAEKAIKDKDFKPHQVNMIQFILRNRCEEYRQDYQIQQIVNAPTSRKELEDQIRRILKPRPVDEEDKDTKNG